MISKVHANWTSLTIQRSFEEGFALQKDFGIHSKFTHNLLKEIFENKKSIFNDKLLKESIHKLFVIDLSTIIYSL